VSVASVEARAGWRRIPVRFRILGVLLALSFTNYLLRNNISIAMPSIREEFGFSYAQVGWIFSSFTIAYMVFQVPGGLFGQALGARRALTIVAVAWGVLTLATGLVPTLLAASAGAAIVGLMVVRFLMGMTHAPIFPVSAGAFARWFPVGHWAFPNAMQSVGLGLGQACVGPLVTVLIVAFGWRASFYCLAPLAFVVAAWWWWYGRDTPADHPAVGPEELALIEAGREELPRGDSASGALRSVLRNPNVLLLAASYFCFNCVFYMFADWMFTYLVDERGFSLLAGGMMFALPFIVGAAGAAAGGVVCDWLCSRIGPKWGLRLPASIALVLVAVLLLAGAHAANAYVAVGLLALCFGCTQFADSAFWSGATYAGGAHTYTATSVVNTGGNIPGFLAPVIGWMIDQLGWINTFGTGSVLALASAGLWLAIDVTRRPAAARPS
jgi:ACS family glucarate transporter-like MFS transporter